MPDRIVEIKPRPRDRVTITLSGGRFFTVPVERAASLSVGMEPGEDAIALLDRIDQWIRGREKANRLLALRSRTRHEIRTALAGISVSEPVRDGIVAELEEEGLVDDVRFTRDYARAKAELRFLGPHRLRYDLGKLGVSRDIVDAALAELFEGDQQQQQARALVSRKVIPGAVDEKTIRRIAGLLRRKGYDYEIVNTICAELIERSR